MGNKRHSTLPDQRTSSHNKYSQDLPHFTKNGSQGKKQYSASMHGLGTLAVSDDYDSFDTDTDEIYETEENIKNVSARNSFIFILYFQEEENPKQSS